MSSPVTNRELVIFGIAVVAVAVALTQYINMRNPVGMGAFGWQPRPGFHEGWRGHPDGRFGGPDGRGPGGGRFMAMADTNKDGYITKDELMAGAKTHIDEMFEVMDTDHDGRLSKDELAKGRELMRQRMWLKMQAARGGDVSPAAPAVK